MMKGENRLMHQSQSQRLGHKTKTLLVAVGFSCISVSSFAATQTCAAYELAKAGADAAYKQEVERINNAAKSESSTSDSLGQCLGSLSVSLKIPQFPTISDIIDKVKDEVCNTVKSKINEKWGSLTNTTLDPWSTISSRLPDTSGILPNASSKNVQLNNPAAASGSGEDANSDAFPFHL
ncbi:TPA: hypothetical protein N2Y67_005372 [Escherichia coli]|nr:hypothetical protein [Salmonella enterica]HCL7981993.1 hypothetical protein [Escherichia coli]